IREAGGYSNRTIGISARAAISEKWRSTMSGLSWAPHMKSVGGKTSTPAAPAARASRARSTASCVPTEETPAITGQAAPTSSSAVASERRRSSRLSDDTSEAWPLATMPATPRVSASQRRWRRYAGSSIARSDVKGSTLAGMTPEKRSGSFIAASSPARPLVDDFLGRHDAAVGQPADVRHRTGHHERCHVPGLRCAVEEAAGGLAAVRHLARRRRRAGEPGKDVASDQLDLL